MKEKLRENPIRYFQIRQHQGPAQAHHRRGNVERHQVDGCGGSQPLEGPGRRRGVEADHHVGLEHDAERKRDGHSEPDARREEPFRPRQGQQVGPLGSEALPELNGTAEQFVDQH